MPEELPFTPEEIDEQIDRLSQTPSHSATSMLPEQRLMHHVYALFSAERGKLNRVQQRGRARLVGNSAPILARPPGQPVHDRHRSSNERRSPMHYFRTRFGGEHKRLYRLGSLVAGVLLVALVGGLVAGLVLVRQHQGSATGTQPTPDLRGGVEIVLQATCSMNTHHCTAQQLELRSMAVRVLQKRIKNILGVPQPVVRLQGSDQIVVDLPRLSNEQNAVAVLTQTGKLEFIDTGPTALEVGTLVQPGQYPVRFTGDQLDPNSIDATVDPQSGLAVIIFEFVPSARADFAAYTRQNIGNYLTITMDGKVIESAIIRSEITGQGQISGGNMTLAAAKETANLLRYGALPLPLTLVGQTPISG